MRALSSRPFCPYDGRQAGLLYLPACWRYTTRGSPNAQAFGQARQHAPDQLHRRLLAMKDRAVMLWEIPVAAEAVELPPRAATGMAIGPQIPQPSPTAIGVWLFHNDTELNEINIL